MDGDFSLLYSRWMPALTRYCRRIVRSDADAEDAAQNAMLKAMDALAKGPAPDHLPPWLHKIARNEAISLLRRRGTVAAATDESFGPSLEEIAATRSRLAELLRDVQALPPRQRQALVLRELDGRSHRQIAAELAISEAAAQQAVLEARRSLHAFEAGRRLECDAVQSWLSTHEHARLRTRGVRAHLRDCGECRGFAGALRARPRDLAALVMPVGLVARLGAVFSGGSAAAKGVLAAGVLATAGGALVAGDSRRDPPARSADDHPAVTVTRAAAPVRAAAPAPRRPAAPAAATAPRARASQRTRRAATRHTVTRRPTSTGRTAPASKPRPAASAPEPQPTQGPTEAGLQAPVGVRKPEGRPPAAPAEPPAAAPQAPAPVTGASVVDQVNDTVGQVVTTVGDVTDAAGVPQVGDAVEQVAGSLLRP